MPADVPLIGPHGWFGLSRLKSVLVMYEPGRPLAHKLAHDSQKSCK
jgi:hypothetical protein